MEINDRKFVAVSYELYVGGENGATPELMEKATVQNPLTFIFGMNMMLESFEGHLKGLKQGDKFDFTLPCADAYGEYIDEHVVDLPKSIFEIDGKFDSEHIAVDRMVPMMTEEGQRLEGMVVEIAAETVKMDFNHPLAGEDLHFIGEVLEVRESTDEEMEALLSPCGHCGGHCGNCGEGECEGGCEGGCEEGQCGKGCGQCSK